jgi:hypothetical protein
VEYATISTATTQQLNLDGMDVLGEFGGSCWLEKADSSVIWDSLFIVSEQNRTEQNNLQN